MPVAVLARKEHDSPFPSDPPLPEAVMHNDVVHPQKQNICQTWSRYVYRIKTGIERCPLRCLGILLHRNLCKLAEAKCGTAVEDNEG